MDPLTMTTMKILWFAPDVPFVREYGGGIDIGTRIHSLHAAGNEITLVSFSAGEVSSQAEERVRQHCSRFIVVRRGRVASLSRCWLPYAVASRRLRRPSLHALLADTRFELAIFESPTAAECMAAVCRSRLPTLLRVHNLEARYARANAAAASSRPASIAHLAEAVRMGPFERACFRRADAIAPLSLTECEIVAGMTARPVSHVPIPVEIRVGADRPIAPPYVAYTGSMYLSVNTEAVRWFLRHAWPRVRREVPDAVFAVVGRGPPPDVIAAAGEGAGVVVTGEVEDAQAYIAHASAVVAPIFNGAGVKVKVIEALGHGRPIVATAEAVAGTAIEDGVHAVIRQEAEPFATAVIDILRHPAAFDAMRRSALALFREHHHPDAVARRFGLLVEATASSRADG